MSDGRWVVVVAGIFGATAVAAAALGAHLEDVSESAAAARSWRSANLIHLMHTPALLALGLSGILSKSRAWLIAAILLTAGVVLFSGSLYLSVSLESIDGAPLAPAGGIALMLGWLTLAFAALRDRS